MRHLRLLPLIGILGITTTALAVGAAGDLLFTLGGVAEEGK